MKNGLFFTLSYAVLLVYSENSIQVRIRELPEIMMSNWIKSGSYFLGTFYTDLKEFVESFM